MNTFNLDTVIRLWHLNKNEVARVMFPHIRFPEYALNRVLKGLAPVDIQQLMRLADYIGAPVVDLFGLDDWHGITEENCLTLTKGEYKVKFNNTFFIVYKGPEVICKNVGDFQVMTFDEFINYINNQIKQYENGNNQN